MTDFELLLRCRDWMLDVWPFIMPHNAIEHRRTGRELLDQIEASMRRNFVEGITRHMIASPSSHDAVV